MPSNQDIALMAHLMRRAGFGATYAELEERANQGYEATVEDLLNPEAQPDLEMDILEAQVRRLERDERPGSQPGLSYLPDD